MEDWTITFSYLKGSFFKHSGWNIEQLAKISSGNRLRELDEFLEGRDHWGRTVSSILELILGDMTSVFGECLL